MPSDIERARMKSIVSEVTQRIRERSAPTRATYLARVEAAIHRPRGTDPKDAHRVEMRLQ